MMHLRKQESASEMHSESSKKTSKDVVEFICAQNTGNRSSRENYVRKSERRPAGERRQRPPIKSPIIGTLYRKPSPEKPLFVEVGSTINVGDTVCIIEAMKLFNEIESEVSGTIVKVLIEDSSPVEFDQPLFLVDPS